MTDEPGSPAGAVEAETADALFRLAAGVAAGGSGAELRSLARQVEALAPGALLRMRNALDMRKVRAGRVPLQ